MNLPELLDEFVREDIAKAEPKKGRFRQFGVSSIGALLLSMGFVAATAVITIVIALFI